MNANVDYLGLLNLLRGLRDRGLLSEAETKKSRHVCAQNLVPRFSPTSDLVRRKSCATILDRTGELVLY